MICQSDDTGTQFSEEKDRNYEETYEALLLGLLGNLNNLILTVRLRVNIYPLNQADCGRRVYLREDGTVQGVLKTGAKNLSTKLCMDWEKARSSPPSR